MFTSAISLKYSLSMKFFSARIDLTIFLCEEEIAKLSSGLNRTERRQIFSEEGYDNGEI